MQVRRIHSMLWRLRLDKTKQISSFTSACLSMSPAEDVT
jgi:hypothetical protein